MRATYLPLYAVLYLLSLLISFTLKQVDQLIYFLLCKVFRYRYHVVLQNLARSFPEKTYAEIKIISTEFYRHFGRMLTDLAQMLSLSDHQILAKVSILNPELLEYYHRQGRSVIIMLGHQGNWEYLNILPKYVSFEVHGIYKPLSNPFFNILIKRLRSRFGLKLLPMDQAARYMLMNKDNPKAYIFIADQCPSVQSKCQVDFLHQTTRMFTGAERLAIATDAVVVYAQFNKTEENGPWKLSFSLLAEHPAITAPNEITTAFSAMLEKSIQQAPQYWLWTHRRWKQ
jgi:KDO2-lipid IV(A) lauroyltransferase